MLETASYGGGRSRAPKSSFAAVANRALRRSGSSHDACTLQHAEFNATALLHVKGLPSVCRCLLIRSSSMLQDSERQQQISTTIMDSIPIYGDVAYTFPWVKATLDATVLYCCKRVFVLKQGRF